MDSSLCLDLSPTKVTFEVEYNRLVQRKDFQEPSDEEWDTYYNDFIGEENSLVPYSQSTMQARWLTGDAAIVINDSAIISYVSLIRWGEGIDARHTPFDRLKGVYEIASGWTKTQFRESGIYTNLRRAFIEARCSEQLGIAFTLGIASSRAIASCGWQLVPWNSLIFLGKFLGTIDDTYLIRADGYLHDMEGRRPYQGRGSYPRSVPKHLWKEHLHFWVSSLSEAESANSSFAKCIKSDEESWAKEVSKASGRVLV